jgi:hypothetical protein
LRARTLGVELSPIGVSNADEIERALAALPSRMTCVPHQMR